MITSRRRARGFSLMEVLIVVGMISVFSAITTHGVGDPGSLAGGISEALVTTMLGLTTAIPLVLLYDTLANSTRRVIDTGKDRAVLEQLHDYLPDLVTSATELRKLTRGLSSDDQCFLVRALGPRLPTIVGNGSALRDLLASLSDSAVEACILDTLGETGLRALVGSAPELAETLVSVGAHPSTS